MEGLINPVSIALHMVNAALLFGVLYLLLYKPVRKYMLARSAGIQAELDDAAAKERSALEARTASEKQLSDAAEAASRTIAQGAQQAQQRAEEIMASTQSEADAIIAHAQSEAETLSKAAIDTMHDEVAELAVSMAEKLLSREVTDADHDKLIRKLLERL